MYHSLTITPEGRATGINTWDDWHLIPSSRPLIAPPPFRSQYLDIPGANGKLDVSTLLSGHPVYDNRTGSIEFYVQNGYGHWEVRYSNIMDYLHGRIVKAVLEDDPAYYYQGRMTVNAWKSDKDWSKITLDYTFEPFKYEVVGSLDEWLWDPFSFEDGIIRQGYKNIQLGDGAEISDGSQRTYSLAIASRSYPAIPVFKIKANVAPSDSNYLLIIKDNGAAHHLITPYDTVEHNYSFYDFGIAPNSASTFTMSCPSTASFTINIDYRGGRL